MPKQCWKETGIEGAHFINQGVRTNDIAILVRKNKTIPAIAAFSDRPYTFTGLSGRVLSGLMLTCHIIMMINDYAINISRRSYSCAS